MAIIQDMTIESYLASVPSTHLAGLQQLYEQIKRLCPKATEHISYKKPLFKLNGHPLVGFYASKQHSALFVWSDTVLPSLGALLDGYDTALSTVRFSPGQPLPELVVKAVIETRAREIEARRV